MENFTALFLVPMVSVIFVFITKPISDKNIKFLLNFSGSFLFGIICFHLLPEVFHHGTKTTGLFVVLGILIQTSLETFSKGVEHGHRVKNVSLAIFFSICVHAFIEGMPLHDGHNCSHHSHNHDSYSLLLGIVLHKIPIAIILISLFLKSFTKYKSLLLIILFSLMSPIGAFVGGIDFFSDYHSYINALATGVLLHVSTFMVYDKGEHNFKLKKFITIIIGFLVAFFVS